MLLLNDPASNPLDTYLELLVRYLELDKFNNIKVYKVTTNHAELLKVDNLPKLLTLDNHQVYSPQEISSQLASVVNFDELLIGVSPEEKSETFKYFDLVAANKDNIPKLLDILQNELKESTFLNGNSNIKVSDLYVFAHLIVFMVDSNFETKSKHFNVYRWFNYVQNLRGIHENLKAMKFRFMDEINQSQVVENLVVAKAGNEKKEKQKQAK